MKERINKKWKRSRTTSKKQIKTSIFCQLINSIDPKVKEIWIRVVKNKLDQNLYVQKKKDQKKMKFTPDGKLKERLELNI